MNDEKSDELDTKLKKYFNQKANNLGNNILKCNSFLNHQVDPAFIDLACQQLYTKLIKKHDLSRKVTKIITAPISGVIPAYVLSLKLQIPLVYTRHSVPITFSKDYPIYETGYTSHTSKKQDKQKNNLLIISGEYLNKNDNVIIIDDFLASGSTVLSMLQLCEQAQCNVIGAGFIVEKEFENGRKNISNYINNNNNNNNKSDKNEKTNIKPIKVQFPIESSVIIKQMNKEKDSGFELK